MKKTVLSGVQTSSQPHLGNYIGAVKHWVQMQETYDCFFFAGDLHGITTPHDPAKLLHHTREVIAFYIASGLNPDLCTLFVQSHIKEHAALAWLFQCSSYMGELSRMTQFKDKSKKQGNQIPVGLFVYPTLMTADILLYQPDFVPVGEDQKQHIELARDIALRLNHRFATQLFHIPEPLIQTSGSRIMDLQHPERKMSKSADNLHGVLFIDDTDTVIQKKIKTAMTDSGQQVTFQNAGDGLANLLQLYKVLSGKHEADIEQSFEGKMYGHLKTELADLAVQVIRPIREERLRLLQDTSELDRILAKGAEKARSVSQKTLKKVYDAFGFLPPLV